MDLILATPDGRELKILHYSIDIDLNKSKDFEMIVPYDEWPEVEMEEKSRIYIPNTEYGGLSEEVETSTENNSISVRGFCWRGLLDKKILKPNTGEDYLTISGELNTCIGVLIDRCDLRSLFAVSEIDTGVSVSNYKFDRYTSLLSGLESMLLSVGYKLCVKYIQTANSGYVRLSAEQIKNISNDNTFSADTMLDFNSKRYDRGINHLICLGSGELAARQVLHLYADRNGNISYTQSLFGIDEKEETYEYPNAQTEADLEENGIKRFKELLNYEEVSTKVHQIDEDLDIGDTITAIDYITGLEITKPIANKIFKLENGIQSVEYKIEGE